MARPGGLPEKAADIGVRAGQFINHYKMSKHFSLTMRDGIWGGLAKQIISKTKSFWMVSMWSGPASPPSGSHADNGVRSYKRLAFVDQAARCVKGIDLLVRPIHHRTADRVRAHILLCLLAFYVEWHLRQVWEPLLFEEEFTEDRQRREPVAPQASESAHFKKKTHRTAGDLPVQSFRTLLAHLGTRSGDGCVVCRRSQTNDVFQVTDADALQAKRCG